MLNTYVGCFSGKLYSYGMNNFNLGLFFLAKTTWNTTSKPVETYSLFLSSQSEWLNFAHSGETAVWVQWANEFKYETYYLRHKKIQDSEHVCTTVSQQCINRRVSARTLRSTARHCSSNRSLALTLRNVCFPFRRLSWSHFLRLSSEATHCLYLNLG